MAVDSKVSTDNELCFSLKYWCVWQSESALSANCWPGGEVLPLNDGAADVSFLPMMQRRRLSPLARAACAVAWQGRQATGDMPTIFFSRHGESQYYFEMLQGMATGEPVSPARFSLAVHNAVGGLFSFQTQSFLPYVSLAGGTEDLFAAFIEAAGQLQEVAEVMLVCYEQPLPPLYRRYDSSCDSTWALAMVLGSPESSRCCLRFRRDKSSNDSPAQSLNFVQAVIAGYTRGYTLLERSVWHWSLEHV